MSDELELHRLISAAVEEVGWEVDDGRDFDGAPRSAVVVYAHGAVDAVMGVLDDSGCSVVKTDRLERQMQVLRWADAMCSTADPEAFSQFTDLLVNATMQCHMMGDLDDARKQVQS